MKWEIRVMRIGGIQIDAHSGFGVLLPLGALQWGARYGGRGALFGCALCMMLPACAALQALVHGLAARRSGLAVSQVLLSPLGGLAHHKRPASEHARSGLVGLAANVAVSALLFLAAGDLVESGGPLGGLDALEAAAPPSSEVAVAWLASANLGLAVLGLLPALPLEGGRVLRAALSPLTGAWLAMSMTAALGQGLAVVLVLVGLFAGHPLLWALAALLFVEATRERRAAEVTMAVASPVRRRRAHRATPLVPSELVRDAARRVLASPASDFPVVDAGRVIGVVTRVDVMRALAAGEDESFIASIMRRDVPRVGADERLDEVGRKMVERNTPLVAVFDGERYLGLVSHADIAGALMRGARRRLESLAA